MEERREVWRGSSLRILLCFIFGEEMLHSGELKVLQSPVLLLGLSLLVERRARGRGGGGVRGPGAS